jgi:hypothetical protein
MFVIFVDGKIVAAFVISPVPSRHHWFSHGVLRGIHRNFWFQYRYDAFDSNRGNCCSAREDVSENKSYGIVFWLKRILLMQAMVPVERELIYVFIFRCLTRK